MTYSNPNYIPLNEISLTESNEELVPDRRALIMCPIIHYECAKKYHSDDEGLVNEDKVLELAKANKDLIANGNEQVFINVVIEKYGEFLSSN
tara:strand:- start:727 stop:1002 length:276 start_codon:yes stop_codon:yes gene_type:complete